MTAVDTDPSTPVPGSPYVGVVAAVGGFLVAVWPVLGGLFVDPVAAEPYFPGGSPGYVGFYLVWAGMAAGLLVGVAGVYASHGDGLRRPGVVGLGVTGVGLALTGLGGVLAAAGPADATLPLWGLVVVAVGAGLLGAGALRRGPVDRVAGWLLALSTPGFLVAAAVSGAFAGTPGLDGTFALFSVPYGIAWVLIGYRLHDEGS